MKDPLCLRVSAVISGSQESLCQKNSIAHVGREDDDPEKNHKGCGPTVDLLQAPGTGRRGEQSGRGDPDCQREPDDDDRYPDKAGVLFHGHSTQFSRG